MDGQQEQPVLPAETITQQVSRPIYFPVSPLKLVVMTICTFGLYQIYWFYRHWGFVRERQKSDIMPFGRAIFAPFFCYSLFKNIETTGVSCNISGSIEPGALAAGWIVFTIVAKLPDPFWLASFLAVLFLIPVQMAANEINLAGSPNHDPNRKFSGWNIAAVVIGGPLFMFAVVGTFLPSN